VERNEQEIFRAIVGGRQCRIHDGGESFGLQFAHMGREAPMADPAKLGSMAQFDASLVSAFGVFVAFFALRQFIPNTRLLGWIGERTSVTKLRVTGVLALEEDEGLCTASVYERRFRFAYGDTPYQQIKHLNGQRMTVIAATPSGWGCSWILEIRTPGGDIVYRHPSLGPGGRRK
jgi:hypothetical protein